MSSWSPYEHMKKYPVNTSTREYQEKTINLNIRRSIRKKSLEQVRANQSAEVKPEVQQEIKSQILWRDAFNIGFNRALGRAEETYRTKSVPTNEEKIQEAISRMSAQERANYEYSKKQAEQERLNQALDWQSTMGKDKGFVYEVKMKDGIAQEPESAAIKRSLWTMGIDWGIQTANTIAMAFATQPQTQFSKYRGVVAAQKGDVSIVGGKTTTGKTEFKSYTVGVSKPVGTVGEFGVSKTGTASIYESPSGFDRSASAGLMAQTQNAFLVKQRGEPLFFGTVNGGRTSGYVIGDRSITTVDIIGMPRQTDAFGSSGFGRTTTRTTTQTTPTLISSDVLPTRSSTSLVAAPSPVYRTSLISGSTLTSTKSDVSLISGTTTQQRQRAAQTADFLSGVRSTAFGSFTLTEPKTSTKQEPSFISLPITTPVTKPISKSKTEIVPTPVNPPGIPPIVLPPLIPPLWFDNTGSGFGSSGFKRTRGKRGFGYSASLSSAILGITSKKKPTKKTWSGLEVRPIIIRKGLKRKLL